MGLTSSVFNSRALLLFTWCLITSCASKKVVDTKKETEPPKTEEVQEVVVFGPTSPSPLFRDETKKYGLEGVKGERFYAVDLNNDSYTDLIILPSNYSTPSFYLFDKKKRIFSPIANDPFKKAVKASFLVFHDIDKDGILDVAIGLLNQKTEFTPHPLRIFKGRVQSGNLSYTEVPFAKKIFPTTTLIPLDHNLDGHIDFFQGNTFQRTSKGGQILPDILWSGDGKGTFSNESYLLEKEHAYDRKLAHYRNAKPTIGASLCDVDRNGRPDVLTASISGHENKMWLNLYDAKNEGYAFFDYGTSSGYAEDENGAFARLSGGNTFYSLCTDYNNNGLIDIAVGELTYGYDPPSQDRSSILSGSNPRFPPKFIRTYYSDDKGIKNWSQGDRRGVFADINFDGFTDLLIDNSGFPPKSRLVYFRQSKNHDFIDESQKYGIDILNPAGTVLIDVDRDGRLDILTGQNSLRNEHIPGHLFLMINNIPREGRRSVRFFLHGKKSNADGIGARLQLKTHRRHMQQFVQYSFGEAPSQNERGIYFGLGKDRLESIKVHWPYLNKNGKQVLTKTYNLSKLRFSRHLDLTLCESGRLLKGIASC